MPEVPLTPEEKLLRIIESPKDAVRNLRPQRRLQVPDVRSVLKDLKAQHGDKLKTLLTLKSANIILIGAAGLTTLFLVIDFLVGMPQVSMIMRLEDAAKKMAVGDLVIEKLDPLAVYMQEITQRNVFALPEAQPPPTVKKDEGKSALAAIASNFRVAGIIWSEAPQAIIEDSKTNRTYLVNRGGKLMDARVKDILKDRVVLSYDNQEIEIR